MSLVQRSFAVFVDVKLQSLVTGILHAEVSLKSACVKPGLLAGFTTDVLSPPAVKMSFQSVGLATS